MPEYCSSKAALRCKICYEQLGNALYECTDCNKPTYFCPDCQDCHPPAHRLLRIDRDLDISSPLAGSQENRPSIDSDGEIENERAQDYSNDRIGDDSDGLSLGVPDPDNIDLDDDDDEYVDASCLDSGSEMEADRQTRKKKVYKEQQNNYAGNITRSKHPELAPAEVRLIDLTLSVTPESLMQLATLTKAIEGATSRYIEGLRGPPRITQASVPPASSKGPPGLQPSH